MNKAPFEAHFWKTVGYHENVSSRDLWNTEEITDLYKKWKKNLALETGDMNQKALHTNQEEVVKQPYPKDFGEPRSEEEGSFPHANKAQESIL
ncbi:hypothetical protein PGTUg99_010374 [Puccinia graminis f. sp. tritici]|uniref:Uncharacterized protein n=1 Tax=Puccinia graminis f. sp. tritici TaxID=56615 RepID=A0A5B0NWG6_PUCGR|nr:hypothetical protein PGTUg99_010374 [Puccinia graminis f. sp. tritici]